jgi:hypothetical protein
MDAARDELLRMLCTSSIIDAREGVDYKWAIALAIAALNTPDGYKIARKFDVVVSRSPATGLPLETLPAGTTRNEAISLLQQIPDPKPGSRTLKYRDQLLGDLLEDIRERGFDPTRSDDFKTEERELRKSSSVGTDHISGLPFWLAKACARGIRQSACSIVAAAWAELEREIRENLEPRRTHYLELGYITFDRVRNAFKSHPAQARARSEKTLERSWDESEWGARLAVRRERRDKARARKRRTSRR